MTITLFVFGAVSLEFVVNVKIAHSGLNPPPPPPCDLLRIFDLSHILLTPFHFNFLSIYSN